jgi:acetyl-CoA carboxylase carboxyl transferase subunit beta
MAWNKFRRRKEMPGGLWLQCPSCKQTIFRQEMENRFKVCPECEYHFALHFRERIEWTLDEGSFEEIDPDLAPGDPLTFTDTKPYADRLKAAEEKTGLKDAAIVGTGVLRGIPVAFGILDFSFIGGSMGYVVGEKIARITELATERGLPLIVFSGSGGARMMEGAISLMQMAKTCSALARYDQAGGFYVSVMTNPTTGGVTASYASMGDVNIAEPGALIGFAGPRVIKTTIKQELPEGFQTSEFMMNHGFIDRIIHRAKLREELARMVGFFTGRELAPEPQAAEEGEEPEEGSKDEKETKKSRAKAKAEKAKAEKAKAKAEKAKAADKSKEKAKDKAEKAGEKSKA